MVKAKKNNISKEDFMKDIKSKKGFLDPLKKVLKKDTKVKKKGN